MTPQRSAGVALLLIVLAAHLAWLPRTLEDIDSVNFALGVRDFDVARHQPHPPGYPVVIALAKLSTSTLRAIGVDAAAPRGLAIWSAIAGTAAIPALLIFFRRLEGRTRLAWCATIVVATAPLFWFTGLRPLSDMLGFAAIAWVLALGSDRPPDRSLVLAALLAGLAIGIRVQTAAVTIPAIVLMVAVRRNVRVTALIAGALALGIVAWAIPLLVATGGPSGYLQALAAQAGEDLGGVVMLWTHRRASVAVTALLNTFIWPWDWWPGIAMCVLAAVGAGRLLWRAPRVALSLAVVFGPYAVFHLLFHETHETRYALPLLPVMAYAAMAALEGLPGKALPAAVVGLAAISLLQTVPASMMYAREGAPIFRAFDDMAATAHGGDRVDLIAMHAGARRAAEWAAPILPARVAKAPHGHEWLTMIDLWKGEPNARVWFAADPSRTDLALFDGRSRQLARAYRWGFVEPPFVGGARPNDVDWYQMQAPAWMLDRGWAVTAEVGGVTARDRSGPETSPAIAWLKRGAQETTLVIGGRHLGGPPAAIDLTLNGTAVGSYPLSPGFFVRRLTLPAGALNGGAAYLPLEIKATDGGRISLEQFDAQAPGVPMFAYDTGWQEPEFKLETGRSWRWMSEKSILWVRPVGRDVTLSLEGESPLRYYDAAPHVRVLIGDQEVGRFDPSADFEQTVTLPAALLDRAAGSVSLECSKFFVPGGAGRGGDQRHLALRIYRVAVE